MTMHQRCVTVSVVRLEALAGSLAVQSIQTDTSREETSVEKFSTSGPTVR